MLRRYEPLARHPLIYVEFDDDGNPKSVVNIPQHLNEHYRSVLLDELHTFALEHNAKRRELYREARRLYRIRTHRSASTRRDFQAPEFSEYNASVSLDARAIATVGRTFKMLGEWFDRWAGNIEAGRVGYKLLLALYLKTQDPILGLLFQNEDDGE